MNAAPPPRNAPGIWSACARNRIIRSNYSQALIDFIGEGVLVCDTHMRLLRANAAAERLLGEGFGRQSLDHLPLPSR